MCRVILLCYSLLSVKRLQLHVAVYTVPYDTGLSYPVTPLKCQNGLGWGPELERMGNDGKPVVVASSPQVMVIPSCRRLLLSVWSLRVGILLHQAMLHVACVVSLIVRLIVLHVQPPPSLPRRLLLRSPHQMATGNS